MHKKSFDINKKRPVNRGAFFIIDIVFDNWFDKLLIQQMELP